MRNLCILSGVLLLAAPGFFSQTLYPGDPRLDHGEIQWFQLRETRTDITRDLGVPQLATPFGNDFEAMSYQFGDLDEQEYSHQLVFRKSTGQLVSVARNYQPEINVDALFPPAQTSSYYLTTGNQRVFGIRLRRLSGGRLLLAMGAPLAGQTTGQILLLHEEELANWYPWLAEQLKPV